MEISDWTVGTPEDAERMIEAALRVAKWRAENRGDADWQPSDEITPIVVVVPDEGDMDDARKMLEQIQRLGRDTRVTVVPEKFVCWVVDLKGGGLVRDWLERVAPYRPALDTESAAAAGEAYRERHNRADDGHHTDVEKQGDGTWDAVCRCNWESTGHEDRDAAESTADEHRHSPGD